MALCPRVPGLRIAKSCSASLHPAASVGIQQPVGVCDVVEREATGDFADDRRAFRGECQGIRNQTSKLMETFDPMHTLVLGNEDGRWKELVEIDGGHGTGQLTVVD